MKPKEPDSNAGLSREFNVTEHTLARWFRQDGIADGTIEKKRECIKNRIALKKKAKTSGKGTPSNRKTLAEAERLERRNRIEALLEEKQYLKADEVEKIISMGIQKIELVPVKMESEFQMEAKMVARLRQLLDEAREAWAKGI